MTHACLALNDAEHSDLILILCLMKEEYEVDDVDVRDV